MPIIENMPEAEYHARTEVSKHDLDMIARAPLFYRYKKDNPIVEDDEMNFGSLVHMVVLQPEMIDICTRILPPDAPKRPSITQINAKKPSDETLSAIAWWSNWNDTANGRYRVTTSDLEKAHEMKASLLSNPATAKYLEVEGKREASLFWEREGVKCRARLDIFTSTEIPDLKTCWDASRNGFMKEIGKRRYAHQGEHYLDGAKACGSAALSFVLIAVESVKPYLCAAHQLGETSIEVAGQENRQLLRTYKQCQDSGIWSNIADDHRPLEAPVWSFE